MNITKFNFLIKNNWRWSLNDLDSLNEINNLSEHLCKNCNYINYSSKICKNQNCNNVLCNYCFNLFNTCPTCEGNKDNYIFINLIEDNILNKIKIKCIFSNKCCNFILNLVDLEDHLKNTCNYSLYINYWSKFIQYKNNIFDLYTINSFILENFKDIINSDIKNIKDNGVNFDFLLENNSIILPEKNEYFLKNLLFNEELNFFKKLNNYKVHKAENLKLDEINFNDHKYIVKLKNQKIIGYGKEIKKNYIFQRNFKNNKKIDFGLLKYNDGNYLYFGNLKDNINKHGYSSEIYNEISYYKGYFKNNKRHGLGNYKYDNIDTYKEYFINNYKEKLGIFTYINDIFYTGSWKNDSYGIKEYKDFIPYTYKGNYKYNKKCGLGLAKYDNEDIFLGFFKNNKKNRFGIYYNKEKKNYYERYWKNNKLNGLCFELNKYFNTIFFEYFKENKKEDQGKFYGFGENPEDTKIGTWKENKFQV